jgi:DNA-directed RNA polymerase subunit M/transcription elongation factor TFIIS
MDFADQDHEDIEDFDDDVPIEVDFNQNSEDEEVCDMEMNSISSHIISAVKKKNRTLRLKANAVEISYDNYRDKGLRILKTVLKRGKNADVIENTLNDIYIDPKIYIQSIMFFIDIYRKSDNKSSTFLKEIITDIKKGQFMWKYSTYNNLRDKEIYEYKMITNPIDVKEGIWTCRKCQGKRTVSIQIQTRSADESMTNFIKCYTPNLKGIVCGYQFKVG